MYVCIYLFIYSSYYHVNLQCNLIYHRMTRIVFQQGQIASFTHIVKWWGSLSRGYIRITLTCCFLTCCRYFPKRTVVKTLRKLFLEATGIIHWNRDQRKTRSEIKDRVYFGKLILSLELLVNIRDERVQHYLYLYLYLLTIWIICICICTRTGRGLTRKWAGFNLEVGWSEIVIFIAD